MSDLPESGENLELEEFLNKVANSRSQAPVPNL